jgi:hypothetical protein
VLFDNIKVLRQMLLAKYQDLLSKDFELVISYIFDNYNVTNPNTNELIDKNLIIEHFLSEKKQCIQRCCGVLNSGNPCNRSAMKDQNYCKTHFLKYQKTTIREKISNNQNEDNSITFINESPSIDNEFNTKEKLLKIFIENTLYLHDNHFLYDPNTIQKVGYKNESNEFILTADPFILCSF